MISANYRTDNYIPGSFWWYNYGNFYHYNCSWAGNFSQHKVLNPAISLVIQKATNQDTGIKILE